MNRLIEVKNDIKNSLINKGANVEEGMIAYADYIRNLSPASKLDKIKFGNSRCDTISVPTKYILDSIEYNYKIKSCNMLFSYSEDLVTIEWFDTSMVTDMNRMCDSCLSLKNLPLLDTSMVTDMYGTFTLCESLVSVPAFNTINVTDMCMMFYGCESLLSVPQLYANNVWRTSSMFKKCTLLENLDGIKDLGKVKTYFNCDDMFSGCKNINRQSVINIFNNLYDRTTDGYSMLTLSFEPEVIERLTYEDIAIATNKGWILASYA